MTHRVLAGSSVATMTCVQVPAEQRTTMRATTRVTMRVLCAFRVAVRYVAAGSAALDRKAGSHGA